MPGPQSDSAPGPNERSPYVPHWCYAPRLPRMCDCGHHEGFHAGKGGPCVLAHECGCDGLAAGAWTPDDEFGTDQ